MSVDTKDIARSLKEKYCAASSFTEFCFDQAMLIKFTARGISMDEHKLHDMGCLRVADLCVLYSCV